MKTPEVDACIERSERWPDEMSALRRLEVGA